MLKLLKHLKQSVWAVILIVILLGIQAVCDLALPEYTSNIVNVGIQSGGIEDTIPEVIRKTQLERLLLFVPQQDRQQILDGYTLIDKGSASAEQLKNYPEVRNQPIYCLNQISQEQRQIIREKLVQPMMLVSGFESDSEQVEQFEQQIKQTIPEQMQSLDIFEIFQMMPAEQLHEIIDQIKEQFSQMPEMIIEQSAIVFLKNEYTALGVDTDKIQNNYILFTGIKMLAIALASMVATVCVGYLAAKVAARMGRDMRRQVFGKVVSFSNAELDHFSTASLITRSTNDIQQVQMLMVMLLRVVFYAPIMGVGGVIKVLGTDTSMAWIIGLAVLMILGLVSVLFAVVMPKFKLIQKLLDRLNLVTREILTGIPVIRAFSTQDYEEKRFDKANQDLTKTNLFVNRVMTCMMPMMMLIMNGITVLIVWNGAHSINDGNMQVGDLMAFIQYTMQIIMSFLMISMVSVMLPRASVSVTRIDEILNTQVAVKDPLHPEAAHQLQHGVLEFRNVSFRYPNAEEDVLSDLNFTAKPGQTTAFIGSTGSGKSTLLNLIPRFYDVTQGEILVDGVDIRKLNQHELRDKIGYVPQKGVLFSGTIESNLKYADCQISDEQMKLAAQVAQATDFIEAKEEGYQSDISQGGTNVSGGQKQRLSIARAIAKDPQIYLFDDSFSALDYKTDVTLRKALKEHTENSTVLIVAQRISTILHAEQIIVLDEGKIVGKGTHEELMKTCEEYQQIALSQLSKEELNHE